MATTEPISEKARVFEPVPVESIAIRSGSRVFGLRVPDSSLRPKLILPGDIAVCEHRVEPRHGDVVAALVDGASVLRVWAVQSGRAVLCCPDGQTPPVSAAGLVIQGVVVQVVRTRVQ